jgi:hypothetical protein
MVTRVSEIWENQRIKPTLRQAIEPLRDERVVTIEEIVDDMTRYFAMTRFGSCEE